MYKSQVPYTKKRPQHSIATVFNVLDPSRLHTQDDVRIRSLRCLRGIDAYGVSGFGSAMPESKLSVAAFALHAIPAGCRQVTVALFFYVAMVLL